MSGARQIAIALLAGMILLPHSAKAAGDDLCWWVLNPDRTQRTVSAGNRWSTHPVSVDAREARQALLELGNSDVSTVTSSRQERRRVVDERTFNTFVNGLILRLGPSGLSSRDETPVQTDTDYRRKFRGLDGHNRSVLTWDLRWRLYRELPHDGSTALGQPIWQIMSDVPGDYGKIEIKRVSIDPYILDQQEFRISKASVVMHKEDYLALTSATSKTFPSIRDGIVERTSAIQNKGRPVNKPGQVEGLVKMIGWMISKNLDISQAYSNVKYLRTAFKARFQYSLAKMAKLIKAKDLENEYNRLIATTMEPELSSPQFLAHTETLKKTAANLRKELDLARFYPKPLNPQDTGHFDVDITADRNFTFTNLETGFQSVSAPHQRFLEFKTTPTFADLSDDELRYIGATEYLAARATFLSLELAEGTRSDRGKRSTGEWDDPLANEDRFNDWGD